MIRNFTSPLEVCAHPVSWSTRQFSLTTDIRDPMSERRFEMRYDQYDQHDHIDEYHGFGKGGASCASFESPSSKSPPSPPFPCKEKSLYGPGLSVPHPPRIFLATEEVAGSLKASARSDAGYGSTHDIFRLGELTGLTN